MDRNNDAHKLTWLPELSTLKNVVFIISTVPGPCLTSARGLEAVELEVPLLGHDDSANLVTSSLGKYHKKLTVDDKDRFLGNQACVYSRGG